MAPATASPARPTPNSKLLAFALTASLLLGGAIARAADAPKVPEVVIYTYDSFMAKGGPGPEIIPAFEKSCGCKVRALPSGDGSQILTRLELDKKRGKAVAHVALGIDQHLWSQAKDYAASWGRWAPATWSRIHKDLRVGEGFLPFDYGVFALMADTDGLKKLKLKEPHGLRELIRPEYKRNLIFEDPRTSTPGLALALFAEKELGEDGAAEYWSRMKSQWLTLPQGWSAAYGLFLKGEAPLVWSYTTSQAYHEAHGDSRKRYRAVLFDEGQPLQIEGAFLVKGNPSRQAQQFLEYLVSDDVQKKLASSNWMLPVVDGVTLPASLASVPKPKSTVLIVPKGDEVKKTLERWSRAIATEPGQTGHAGH